MPILGAIEAPKHEFTAFGAVFRETYEHEQMITEKSTNWLTLLSHHKITQPLTSLQWYVAEQHEEEKLFKGVLDKLELVGEDGKALFFIDKDLAQLAKKMVHLQLWKLLPFRQ